MFAPEKAKVADGLTYAAAAARRTSGSSSPPSWKKIHCPRGRGWLVEEGGQDQLVI